MDAFYICCKTALHPRCDSATLEKIILFFKEAFENKKTFFDLSEDEKTIGKFYLNLVMLRDKFITPAAVANANADINLIIYREALRSNPIVVKSINVTVNANNEWITAMRNKIASTPDLVTLPEEKKPAPNLFRPASPVSRPVIKNQENGNGMKPKND
jgi:hypothetical protein